LPRWFQMYPSLNEAVSITKCDWGCWNFPKCF